MDFFQSQADAKRRTGLLVFYYCSAILLIILAVYALSLLIYTPSVSGEVASFWIPEIFIPVAGLTLVILGGGSLYKIKSLSMGGSVIAESLGGRPLILENGLTIEEKRLLNIVEEMALASGVSVPGVYILEKEHSVNAFAAGFTPEDAVIGVTRGAIETLSRDELQGVVAHEFSHILNGDMRLNIKLIGILHGILLLSFIGYSIFRSSLYRTGRRSSSSKDNRAGGVILGLGLLLVGYIGVFFGNLIKSAVSRQREYLADASAVQFTRNPAGISGALEKIGNLRDGSLISNKNAAEASHLFFASSITGFLGSLMSTHPPLKERIKRIRPDYEPEIREEPNKFSLKNTKTNFSSALSSFENPVSVSSTVGTSSPEKLSYSTAIIKNIPDSILAAAHSSSEAAYVIYTLLLSSESETRESQYSLLREYSLEGRVAQLSENIRKLPEEEHLPLLEIAISSLKKISHQEYSLFKNILSRLIDADGKVSLTEYLIRGMVLRHLEPSFGIMRRKRIRYKTLHPVEQDLRILLYAVSEFGVDNEKERTGSYIRGLQALGIEAVGTSDIVIDLYQIDDSLSRLNELSFPLKKKLIDAAALCALSDNYVTVAQARLLRIIADSLGCPLPPIKTGRVTDS